MVRFVAKTASTDFPHDVFVFTHSQGQTVSLLSSSAMNSTNFSTFRHLFTPWQPLAIHPFFALFDPVDAVFILSLPAVAFQSLLIR